MLSQYGADATPAYSLRHPDPTLPASINRYAVALYDSYNPEILFGEVLLIPQWTQPSLSQEEIRLNGGVPPPPQPILPTEFVIQLYNPDQQVIVKWHTGTWSSAAYWDFELPQQSFRQPSTSAIDRAQSDPTASEVTPKLGFRWKKEGKLSKDYVCSLSGKSSNVDGSKRKNREPDIILALFKNYREITVYEPNLNRVDLEDPKGLEVVLLLGAIVIREVYSSNMRETFNITEAPRTPTIQPPAPIQYATTPEQPPRRHQYYPSPQPQLTTSQSPNSHPPPTDPRSQWELDAETARLKKQAEHEERERRRAEHSETKRVKKMLEEEQREQQRRARQKQAEVDRETERLQKLYAKENRQGLHQLHSQPPQKNRPPVQQGRLDQHPQAVTAYPPAPVRRPHSAIPYIAQNLQPQTPYRPSGPYLGPQGNASTVSFATGPSQNPNNNRVKPKKSFWSMRSGSDNDSRLTKQRSTVF